MLVKRQIGIAAASIISIAAAVPAQAVVGDYVYTGTVGSLTDTSGVFGGAVTGSQFTIAFRVDTDRGHFGIGGGGSGSGGGTYGGTKYIGTPNALEEPNIVLSPVSAILTINGRALTFAGAYYGDQATSSSFFFDRNSNLQSSSQTDELAQDQLQDGTVLTTDRIEAGFNSDPALPIPYLAGTYALTFGAGMHSFGSFDYTRFDQATGQTIATSGTLLPTSISIAPEAAVPEPASWALLLTGFGVTGMTLRRRRQMRPA